MSNYTISIKELIDNDINIFDFNYNFYNDSEGAKELFEQKFIDTYMYYEIGFEEVDMFKHYLKSHLNNLYPYYKQLYETELRCMDIDFMLNKDLQETFTREINNQLNRENVTEGTSEGTNNINSSLIDDYSESTSTNTKDSAVNNGISSAELVDGYLTSVQSNTESNNYDLTETNTSTSTGSETINQTNTTNENNNTTESTELISKGNIGVTSSAELLEKWRKVLLNIDMMLLDELRKLFLMIY